MLEGADGAVTCAREPVAAAGGWRQRPGGLRVEIPCQGHLEVTTASPACAAHRSAFMGRRLGQFRAAGNIIRAAPVAGPSRPPPFINLRLFTRDNTRAAPCCVIIGVSRAGNYDAVQWGYLPVSYSRAQDPVVSRARTTRVSDNRVTTMRAAYYSEPGAAWDVLRLGERPTPEPGPGEVRVRLRTSGVNPSDWKARRCGLGRSPAAAAIIPHSAGAGDIDAVGPGVPSHRVGERVWVWNGQWKRPHGTAAEYIALPSPQAVPLPPNLSYPEGACLGIPALEAVHAVRLARLGPGSEVLITSDVGSVASYAIQLAKLRDATVISMVASDDGAAHANQVGADAIIDPRSEDVGERVKALTCGRGIDAVIELNLPRNAGLYPEILRPHAVVVACETSGTQATLPALFMTENSITLRLFLVHDMNEAERAAGIAELNQWLKEGRLVHTVGRRLPLERIAEAHEAVECNEVLGTVVLDIS